MEQKHQQEAAEVMEQQRKRKRREKRRRRKKKVKETHLVQRQRVVQPRIREQEEMGTRKGRQTASVQKAAKRRTREPPT